MRQLSLVCIDDKTPPSEVNSRRAFCPATFSHAAHVAPACQIPALAVQRGALVRDSGTRVPRQPALHDLALRKERPA